MQTHDLRDWTHDRHRTVDDYPFGGGAGMVMKPEPIFEAIEAIQPMAEPPATVVLMSPLGRRLDRALVDELATLPRMLILCGRYEGIDERVIETHVDEEISIGNYVLSGGELAAAVVVDAVARLIPGVLGNEDSARDDSFAAGAMQDLLEGPVFTKPPSWRGLDVPEVLLSGHHGRIAEWRRAQAQQLQVNAGLARIRQSSHGRPGPRRIAATK